MEALSIPAKEFEFTDPELARVKTALQTWESCGAIADRRWLEPLLNAIIPEPPSGLLKNEIGRHSPSFPLPLSKAV